jgi:AcrR family transcriptional regulator
MARPRKVSDEEVYAATMRVMSRVGPTELTLQEIARETGVTPGALVQRFGSRRELLASMASVLSSGMGDLFAQLRAKHDAPLDVIRAYAAGMAAMARTPADLSRNFEYLQVDMTDPDLRQRLVDQSKGVRRELAALLREAISTGELSRKTDVPALVRNIEALISGALLTWGFYQQGSAESWVRRHIDALLRPHMAVRQGK